MTLNTTKIFRLLGLAYIAAIVLAWVVAIAALAMLTGCAGMGGGSTSRVDGASSTASGEREETTPSETRSREVTITIEPRADSGKDTPSVGFAATSPVGDGGGSFGDLDVASAAVPGRLRVLVMAQAAAAVGAHRSETGATEDTTGWQAASATQSTPKVPSIDGLEGLTLRAGENSTVTVTFRETETTTAGVMRERRSAASDGASLRTSSGEAVIGFDSAGGGADVGEFGSASSGGSAMSSELRGAASPTALYVIGGLCIAGAAGLLAFGKPRPIGGAAAFAGAGLALIAAGVTVTQYPWVLMLALVGLIGVLGYAAWTAVAAKRKQAALDAVVPAVELAGGKQGAGRIVKDKIAVVAEATGNKAAIDKVIDASKARTAKVVKANSAAAAASAGGGAGSTGMGD